MVENLWPFELRYDRDQHKLYVTPEGFDSMQRLAHGVDEFAWRQYQDTLRRVLRIPPGTEIAVVVRQPETQEAGQK